MNRGNDGAIREQERPFLCRKSAAESGCDHTRIIRKSAFSERALPENLSALSTRREAASHYANRFESLGAPTQRLFAQ